MLSRTRAVAPAAMVVAASLCAHWVGGASPSIQSVGITGPAATLLSARASASTSAFYLYQDADAGSHHGFPSGAFASTGALGKLQVNSACLDDANQPAGCSVDQTRLDRTRGTVFAMTFSPLGAGEFVGRNFEEPENWGVLQSGVGYDLRGATHIAFDVRVASVSPIGLQFSVAAKVAAYRTYAPSPSFTSERLELATVFGITPSDLQNAHLLFGIATNAANGANGGTVLLDNLRFEPAPAAQATRPSLPLANETFGVVPVSAKIPRVDVPSDQLLRNLATIYESAIVTQALLLSAVANGASTAVRVSDALVYAVDRPNTGLSLPAAPSGARGLQSGLSSGDLALLNDQPSGAKAGEVRLSGFTGPTTLCGPSQFCVLLDGGTGGNNAFVVKALLAAYLRTGTVAYLDRARSIAAWIHGVLLDSSGTGYGGYYLGFADQGILPKLLLLGKSIENNADIFSAFSTLANVERALSNAAAAAMWDSRARIAGDFVVAMFDAAAGRFYAGTVPVGSGPGPGVTPAGPTRGNDVINTFDFLDAQTFPILAMAESNTYRTALDWRRPLQWAIARQVKTIGAGGRTFRGFNLVSAPEAGPDGIAWEFTGQMVVAMTVLDRLYSQTQFQSDAASYLNELRQAQLYAPFTDGRGLPAATLQGGDQLPPYEHCLSTPFQCVPQRVGLAATAWAIFADTGFNPLNPLPPTAVDDAYGLTWPGTPLVVNAPGPLGNDVGRDDALRAELLTTPTSGTLQFGTDGAFTYTPAAGFFGVDAFTYRPVSLSGVGAPATVRITVDPATVQPPTGLRVSSSVGNSVTFRWTPPTLGPPPTAYALEGGLGPGDAQASLLTTTADPVLTVTAPSGAFYVRVHSIRPGERSAPSSEIRLFVDQLMPPSMPVALLGLRNGADVALSWRGTYAGGTPAGFVLDVSGAVTGSLPVGLAESFSFSGVPPGTLTFAVRAVNAFGTSPASAPVTLTFPGACSGPPLTPTNFLAYRTDGTVNLMWESAETGPAPTSYRIDVGGTFTGSVPLNARRLSAAPPPGTYRLSVAAMNPCGASAPTAVQQIVVP